MKQFVSWCGVILGLVGVALCVAGLVGVWIFVPRWEQKTIEAYAKIDEALVHAQDRIDLTQQRVGQVNALTADLRTSLKEWVIAEQFDERHVGHRAELIAANLHHVGDGLGFASTLLGHVRSAQKLAHPFRTESRTDTIDNLLEELGVLQEHVSGVVHTVDNVRQRAEQTGSDEQLEDTIEQALAEVVQVLKVIETAEDRLGELSSRVTEARTRAEQYEHEVLNGLWGGKLAASILLPWMAIGQIALFVLARRYTGASERTHAGYVTTRT